MNTLTISLIIIYFAIGLLLALILTDRYRKKVATKYLIFVAFSTYVFWLPIIAYQAIKNKVKSNE